MACEKLRGVCADVPDAKGKKQAREWTCLRLRDALEQVARGQLCKSLQLEEHGLGQVIQISVILEQLTLEKLRDRALAEAANIHCILRDEVHNTPVDPVRAGCIRTVDHDLI